ncbi:MAG: transporter, partial [Betaproteobacteria bacterium]|nr:transporter [Betaproteobacteria bacterium]
MVTLSNAAGVFLDLFGFNNSIGGLAGGGSTGGEVKLGAGNLTLGVVNGNDSYAGLISGTGSLIKVGSGTQTLMSANSFSGGARVNSGTLAIGAAEALGTGNLTLASNNTTLSTLANMTVTNGIVLNAAGFVNTGTNRVNSTGTISGSGSLNKQGTGTLVLSGSNTFSGGTLLNAGTISFGSTDALGSGNLTFVSNSVLQSTANLNITNRVVINSGVTGTFDYGNYTMTNSGVISGAGNFLKSGNGALSLTASNTFGGTMQIN